MSFRECSYGLMTAAFAALLTSCVSAPRHPQTEHPPIPPAREVQLASNLSRNLENALGRWKDEKAEAYLNALLVNLVAADKSYKAVLPDVKIKLLGSDQPYVASGLERIVYLSRGMIRTAQYENELAFILATQLSLLRDKATFKSLSNLDMQDVSEEVDLPSAPPTTQKDYLERDWFEPGGLFDFGTNQYLKAETDGIKLVYAARFDPRGSVTLIQRVIEKDLGRKAVGKIMPDPEERLRGAREEVAKLSPLRDPIVRTRAFSDLQDRIQAKKAR